MTAEREELLRITNHTYDQLRGALDDVPDVQASGLLGLSFLERLDIRLNFKSGTTEIVDP